MVAIYLIGSDRVAEFRRSGLKISTKYFVNQRLTIKTDFDNGQLRSFSFILCQKFEVFGTGDYIIFSQ